MSELSGDLRAPATEAGKALLTLLLDIANGLQGWNNDDGTGLTNAILAIEAEAASAAKPVRPAPGGVHNHDPEGERTGVGIECPEYLIGRCLIDAANARTERAEAVVADLQDRNTLIDLLQALLTEFGEWDNLTGMPLADLAIWMQTMLSQRADAIHRADAIAADNAAYENACDAVVAAARTWRSVLDDVRADGPAYWPDLDRAEKALAAAVDGLDRNEDGIDHRHTLGNRITGGKGLDR